jgi:excisionase family DNA binding protein
MSRFYTINEIASMFGVTRATIYQWMNGGKLAYIVVGCRRRIPQEALDAFIKRSNDQKQEPDA